VNASRIAFWIFSEHPPGEALVGVHVDDSLLALGGRQLLHVVADGVDVDVEDDRLHADAVARVEPAVRAPVERPGARAERRHDSERDDEAEGKLEEGDAAGDDGGSHLHVGDDNLLQQMRIRFFDSEVSPCF